MRTTLFLFAAVALVGCGKGSDGSDSTPSTNSGVTTGSTTSTAFVFATEGPEAYTRVDRMGMPAVNTAVITSKDAYNQADPTDDINGDFVAEITDNVTAIHAALDDDLTGLGLVPCAPADCLAQAAPLVVPDTLKIDTAAPAGFPNGRKLEDPVVDITLAVVLLDLVNTPGQDATTLIGVNPTANDVPFPGAYPWLAAPQ